MSERDSRDTSLHPEQDLPPPDVGGINRRGFLSGSVGATATALAFAASGTASSQPAGDNTKGPAILKSKGPSFGPAKILDSERDQRVDPKTGIRVFQITNYPVPHAHFTYDWPSVTPDNQRVVFFGQRFAQRDAPWDLYRCDTDGLGLMRLTSRGDQAEEGGYYGCPASILALDGKTVYLVWDKLLCAVEVETGNVEELLDLGKLCPAGLFSRPAFSSTGELYFTHREGIVASAVRVNLSSGKAERVETQGHLMGCFQEEPRLLVQRGEVLWGSEIGPDGVRIITNQGDEQGLWTTDESGGDARFICPTMFAHMTILGRKSILQGCGKRPHTCIWLVEEEREPRKLVEGPYFWHSGASYDGEWILADTNNPDEGLNLAHVPTGHFKALCYAEATQDHHNFGHPHPSLSQDGRVAVYRSDRTHVPQIYIAHINDEFRERVIAGEPDLKG